ncbi:FecR family protein [Parapedobacter koreensis]|uniref:FecR family protein n=1 Tax=Parapedobacter koreensis TaxID=332977 RepID=A0A1H7GGF9_9SPHI|nr:FecR domain-containing protein [Parapedobacter koreensis]SEK36617.1 FecR family protein [Parapedobacter koreensis]
MNITPALLEKYYRGQCTADEKLAIEQWQQSSEIGPEVTLPPEIDKRALKQQLWAPLATDLEKARRLKRSANARIFWRVAACITLLAGLAIGYSSLNRKTGPYQNRASNDTYKTIRTEKGQKASITLPDGTIIKLNNQSELRYPEPFADTCRLVYLSGEAYFDVAKDPAKPFVIHTPTTRTCVLGTEFNLKAYPNEQVVLAVVEGKVVFGGVGNKQQGQPFSANQLGVYSTAGKIIRQTVSSLANHMAWTENKLIFDKQPLTQVIPIIERWYNIRIQLEEPALSQEKFTGEFNNPSLHFLLDRMAFVMKFDYTLDQQTVTIN